ncbi:MaoC/PaaZ C-terminal domain-containing protein [Atlantibacter hermannii]|nr:MaoC/PaaZ C-terminal domain-containing protein [Atlantibacter hermannii]
MMEWIYTPADALQWADFSGDDNPIHFDGTLSGSAQRMANSVHGMRALLDVKQALANA